MLMLFKACILYYNFQILPRGIKSIRDPSIFTETKQIRRDYFNNFAMDIDLN